MVTSGTFHRPALLPELEGAIFSDARLVLIEGATKVGKTTSALVWLLEQALTHGRPGRAFWWAASVYSTSEVAYRRLLNGLPAGIARRNDSKLTITLPNGATIHFKSAEKPDSLYGDDVYACVGDECSRWREPAWHAIRTTITATGGPVRFLYNTRGRTHWAYKLAQRVKSGDEPGSAYHVFTCDVAVKHGLYSRDEVDAARRDLPEPVFNELYYCQPADDAANPFGLTHVAACVAPLSTLPPVAYGIDLARSQDYTVVIGLDKNGAVCRFERWQSPWEMTFSRIVGIVGTTPALVDSTGAGDPITERLQSGRSNYASFHFTQSTKQQLMERLAVAIQQREIRYPDGPIRAELESFEYEYTRMGVRYEGKGAHDDCVMALALAAKRVKTEPMLPYWWLREDPEFRKQVLGEPATPTAQETDAQRIARRRAAYFGAYDPRTDDEQAQDRIQAGLDRP